MKNKIKIVLVLLTMLSLSGNSFCMRSSSAYTDIVQKAKGFYLAESIKDWAKEVNAIEHYANTDMAVNTVIYVIRKLNKMGTKNHKFLLEHLSINIKLTIRERGNQIDQEVNPIFNMALESICRIQRNN